MGVQYFFIFFIHSKFLTPINVRVPMDQQAFCAVLAGDSVHEDEKKQLV